MHFIHRNFALIVLLLALFCVPMPAFAALDTLTTTIDDTQTEIPAFSDGTTVFMNASDIASMFDVEYTFDSEKETATFILGRSLLGKKEAIFTVNSTTAVINGKKTELNTAPLFVDGTILIPTEVALPIWNASFGANEKALYIHTDGSDVVVPEIQKVFVEKQAITIGDNTSIIQYIRIPADVHLKADLVFAQNSIGKVEELSNMATRTSAKAAINGGYFQSFDETKAQEPYGVLIKNGQLIHSDNTGSTLGFTKDGTVKLDMLRSNIIASINKTNYTVSLMNHSPISDSNTIALFTPAYGDTLNANGASVIVQNGCITSIHNNKNVTIPKDGYVLLFTGNKSSVVANMQNGDAVSYTVSYVNANNDKVNWSDVQTAVGAGPILIKDGKVSLNPKKEGFTDENSFQIAVARSAIGITEDGTILLVGPIKCSAKEMATIMLELKVVQAIAMDSGSSAGLYSSTQEAVTHPMKAISNALIFK